MIIKPSQKLNSDMRNYLYIIDFIFYEKAVIYLSPV